MTRWTEYFLDLCDLNASMSKDPSTKVGAVIARPDRTVASMGWNGFARGTSDDPAIYAERYPHLTRAHLLRERATEIDGASFELALESLLDGLDAKYALLQRTTEQPPRN